MKVIQSMDPRNNQNQIPQKEPALPKPIVRTYQSDVAEALKEKKGSIVGIAAAEEKRRQKNVSVFPPDTEVARKKKLFLFAAVFLIIAGIVVSGFLFFAQQKVTTQTETLPIVVSSVLFANTQKEMPIDGKDRDALTREITKEIKGANIRLDFIEHLFFTKTEGSLKTLVPVRDFFSLSYENIPSILLRSFEEDYMFGIHAFNGNIPFLVARLNSFENAFSGMLKWEKFMADDILPLFGKIDVLKTLDEARNFEDYLFINQDTRVLRNKSGDIVLWYAFPDRNTLVITTGQDTFKEIIDRLKTSKSAVQ